MGTVAAAAADIGGLLLAAERILRAHHSLAPAPDQHRGSADTDSTVDLAPAVGRILRMSVEARDFHTGSVELAETVPLVVQASGALDAPSGQLAGHKLGRRKRRSCSHRLLEVAAAVGERFQRARAAEAGHHKAVG